MSSQDINKGGKMVISFITEQGGVGKTSLCFNLAWFLASQNKKVLMIDMDAQGGNLSYAAGVPNLEDKNGVNEILEGSAGISDCIYKLSPNLSIIPANNNAMFITDTVSRGGLSIDCLKKEINKIKRKYDYIFIDTNPTPSIIHVISLVASDELIVPLTTDAKSIEGTKHILDTYEDIKTRNNKKLEIKAIVYNKYERRTSLSKVVEGQIRELCGTKGLPIAQTRIPSNITVAETMLAKEGITSYSPGCKGSIAYKALAKELFGVTEVIE
jgi:chromosome partitioning protein